MRLSPYNAILQDLLQDYPPEVIPCPPPYDESSNIVTKFNNLISSLDRSTMVNNRLLQLTNVFYLGKLLVKGTSNRQQRNYFARQLTEHYRKCAIRTYCIFEKPGIKQIMRTTRTTLTQLRRLSNQEYQDLIAQSLRIFNGVENSEESDVMPIIDE
jgi:hypothetical protein